MKPPEPQKASRSCGIENKNKVVENTWCQKEKGDIQLVVFSVSDF